MMLTDVSSGVVRSSSVLTVWSPSSSSSLYRSTIQIGEIDNGR